MRNVLGGGNAMTAHISGSSLDSQKRYSEGTKEILRRWIADEKQDAANVIVTEGDYATKAYGQHEAKARKTEQRTEGVSS
jgi:formate dehydrogenase